MSACADVAVSSLLQLLSPVLVWVVGERERCVFYKSMSYESNDECCVLVLYSMRHRACLGAGREA